jgi:hypothetical protein
MIPGPSSWNMRAGTPPVSGFLVQVKPRRCRSCPVMHGELHARCRGARRPHCDSFVSMRSKVGRLHEVTAQVSSCVIVSIELRAVMGANRRVSTNTALGTCGGISRRWPSRSKHAWSLESAQRLPTMHLQTLSRAITSTCSSLTAPCAVRLAKSQAL